jgi:hypothetical protein
VIGCRQRRIAPLTTPNLAAPSVDGSDLLGVSQVDAVAKVILAG